MYGFILDLRGPSIYNISILPGGRPIRGSSTQVDFLFSTDFGIRQNNQLDDEIRCIVHFFVSFFQTEPQKHGAAVCSH